MADQIVKFTGDEKDAARAIDKLKKKNEDLRKGLAKTRREAKKAEQDFKKSFGANAAGKLASYAAGLATITGALSLVRGGLNDVQEAQAKAFITQERVSKARQELLFNLGGQTRDVRRGAIVAGVDISARTGVGQADVFKALAAGVTSAGGELEPAIKAVNQAAQILSENAEAIPEFAGALIGISKVTQDIVKGFDPEVAQGLLQKAGVLSRIVEPSLQATNIAPALIGAVANDATVQEAIAAFAALSTAAEDVTGRRTGTALISLSVQLKEFFQEDRKARASRTEFLGGQDSRVLTFGERVDLLQGDERLRERFLKEASFEVKLKAPVEALIGEKGPESIAAAAFETGRRAIPSSAEELRAFSQRAIAGKFDDPLFATQQRSRDARAAIEGIQTADTGGAAAAVAREAVTEGFKATDPGIRGSIERKVAELSFELGLARGGDPGNVAADILKLKARRLEAPFGFGDPTVREGLEGIPFTEPGELAVLPFTAKDPLIGRLPPTEEEIASAQALRRLADVIERLIPAVEADTAATIDDAAATMQNSEVAVNISQTGGGQRSAAPPALSQGALAE